MNIIGRLHQAVVTASNDDWSEAGTEKRRRHVERLETLRDAVDDIARLTAERDAALAENRSLHDTRRWNIQADGADLLICTGAHEKGAPCDFHRYHSHQQKAPGGEK